jgi:A/G-specific adenine glycosylase
VPRNPKPKIKDRRSASAFRRALTQWFKKFGRDLPWRGNSSPYAVLVSEFMLQQTQVATVIPYFERWIRRFPDFTTLASSSESAVLGLWQGLGYYTRARNLHRAAQHVVDQYAGALPNDLEAISGLPGVGRYTAAAIASFAFDRSVPTVDGNIARVLARLFNIQEPIDTASGQAAIWTTAESLLPEKSGRLYTSALMELGALLCTPRNPQCLICPVRKFCAADEPGLLPRKKSRSRTIQLEEPCVWIRRGHRILLQQQTGKRWKGLWKLPRLEAAPDTAPLHESSYPFTNHRVNLRVFRGNDRDSAWPASRWITLAELEDLPITAPHRRAIRALLSNATSPTKRKLIPNA